MLKLHQQGHSYFELLDFFLSFIEVLLVSRSYLLNGEFAFGLDVLLPFKRDFLLGEFSPECEYLLLLFDQFFLVSP